jgi:hypothetical protein
MQAQNVLTVSATRTCSRDVWNIDVELVRTQFHTSLIFHTAKFYSGTAAILELIITITVSVITLLYVSNRFVLSEVKHIVKSLHVLAINQS